jgi:carboxylesterase
LVIYPSFTLSGSKKCAMLVHGFTGSPYEMKYIADGIHNALGWTVRVPRLPGHSTTTEDFLSTGWKDWLRRTYDEYLDLFPICEEVIIGGLSMGGILAVMTAVKFNVKKILLYAPAFTTAFQRYIPMIYLLSFFRDKTLKSEDSKPFEDPIDEQLHLNYWRYNFYKQAREFFELQRRGKKVLKDFDGEALVVVSKNDRTVPIDVIDILQTMKGKMRKVILENSGHVVTKDIEKDKVLEETLRFLEG